MTTETEAAPAITMDDLLETLEAALELRTFRKIDFFGPYKKQNEFFALGRTKRERLLKAGNQLGKSEAGAVETTYHLTGEYPADWTGRVFTHPPRGWACGVSSSDVRNVMQKKLCGEPGVEAAFGTGFIPKERFVDKPSTLRGTTDAYDTIQVEHRTNGIVDGISVLRFKSYEQGREKFQGETLDFFWCDEEPPADVYSEILTRITATKGMGFITFTPLKGMSEVVARFMHEHSEDRAVVTMTIEDALHIPAEERQKIIDGYLPHEREARVNGVPMLGEGRIFLFSEEQVSEPVLTHIPAHWVKLWGIDFGIGHPFAAVLLLWDRDNDVIHVHHAVRVRDQYPPDHARAMKAAGANAPVAWPQDGTQREKSGKQVAQLYRDEGLRMHDKHATFPDGGLSTEAGILEMYDRMRTGRLKVANHLTEWFEEFREYHRKDGKIVKERDDLMSATRVGIMMKRIGQAVPLGSHFVRRTDQSVAEDVDFDLG